MISAVSKRDVPSSGEKIPTRAHSATAINVLRLVMVAIILVYVRKWWHERFLRICENGESELLWLGLPLHSRTKFNSYAHAAKVESITGLKFYYFA